MPVESGTGLTFLVEQGSLVGQKWRRGEGRGGERGLGELIY